MKHYENVPSDAIHYYQSAASQHFLQHTTAHYDPVFTPLFTAILGTGAFQIGAATISYASVAAAIATTALSIGIQMLMAPKPPKPEDGKVPKTQPVPYRQWGVGRVRVAGSYMLWEAKAGYLFAVQAIAGHRIKSVNRYWLHDDEVQLQPDGTIVDGTSYAVRVRIMSRIGLVPETAYTPIVDFLGAEGVWTSSHRGDGQASIAMMAKSANAENQQKRFPYGPPQLSVEADMALCWDYRDPSQSPTNPSTWTWTRNTALQMCWHQCFNEFGHRRDYRKAILPVLDMWKEEADVCDELVPLKGGGTEKRYESGGFDTTENDPKAGTNALLAACDGWICERGDGALLFVVGKFREKYVVTITDADITGHQVEYDVLFEDECNRLIPKFSYPEIGYATSDADFFEDVPQQIIAGRILAQEASYMWVQKWRQARRLGIRDWRRLQQKVSGTLSLRLSGINAVYSRWVRLSTPLSMPRLNGKIVENRKSLLSLMQGAFSMDIMQHPDNIDDWNPLTDEGAMPPVPPRTGKGTIDIPVINLVQSKPRGDSVYIRVVVIDPEDDSLYPVVRYRVADDGSGNPGAWVEQKFPNVSPSGGYLNLSTNVVPSNALLDIQVAYIASDNDYGEWSVTANVTSTVDDVNPASPEALDWTAPNFSARAANTTAPKGRTAYLTFKIGLTTQSFADAALVSKLAAAPGDVRYVQPAVVAGQTRRLWCQAENVSGLTSATVFIDRTFV
ncbi:MAG: hypothetical protein EON58_00725 [Alphaproteobacteria bacterium]|nr:MAG: hypothetical protein EON58_00725 [Alphaproteobacteria bacterium]